MPTNLRIRISILLIKTGKSGEKPMYIVQLKKEKKKQKIRQENFQANELDNEIFPKLSFPFHTLNASGVYVLHTTII